MNFFSKKELLIYLGKDPKDVRLINRMIDRGEVRVDGDVFILNKEPMEATIRRLKAEIEQLKKASAFVEDETHPSELTEAKANAEYYLGKYKKMVKAYNTVIEIMYKKSEAYYKKMNIDLEEFRKQVNEEIKNLLD